MILWIVNAINLKPYLKWDCRKMGVSTKNY